ncbi:MAG: DUF488 domain-containing protein [Selenomonadaceae bacterium]|jgi:uncharacterized protein (DUF488 family)|nr:DUF488 domain-containing protein [Selenomonadaceae bacterium]
MGKLYTIGHSTVEQDFIIDLLVKYGIDYVYDVRSTPYSRYAEQFNRENIKYALIRHGIGYHYAGAYFGARQEDEYLYNKEGYLDFNKVRQSQKFNKGVEGVKRGLEQGHSIALMCTEKDPIDCHRAIMVARGFELVKIPVEHILHDGKLQSQHELNMRLLDMFHKDRQQLSLFDDDMSEEEYLEDSYAKRNKDIGFRIENLLTKEAVG